MMIGRRGVFIYFDFTKSAVSDEGNIKGKCTLCIEKPLISGRKNVSSNFVKHLRVCKINNITITTQLSHLMSDK